MHTVHCRVIITVLFIFTNCQRCYRKNRNQNHSHPKCISSKRWNKCDSVQFQNFYYFIFLFCPFKWIMPFADPPGESKSLTPMIPALNVLFKWIWNRVLHWQWRFLFQSSLTCVLTPCFWIWCIPNSHPHSKTVLSAIRSGSGNHGGQETKINVDRAEISSLMCRILHGQYQERSIEVHNKALSCLQNAGGRSIFCWAVMYLQFWELVCNLTPRWKTTFCVRASRPWLNKISHVTF